MCALFFGRSGLAEPPPQGAFSVRGKRDDATIELASRPAQGEDALEDGRTERAAEVMASLAPVETGTAERAARSRKSIEIESELGEERFALAGDGERVAAAEELALAQTLQRPHTALPGEMVVANARDAHRRIGGTGTPARSALRFRPRGDAHQLFQHRRDI